MKAGSLILFLLFVVVGLVYFVAPPQEKRILRDSTVKVIDIIKARANILWDKFRGIDSYTFEGDEEEEPFGDGQDGGEWLENGVS